MRTTVIAAALITAVVSTTGAAAPPEAAPADTVAATDRSVTFKVDGTTTYGTVHVPAHRVGQRLAGALLLPGSGATDRDGDAGPTFAPQTLKLIAGLLDQDGIASLRFDKYFTGQTGPGTYEGRLGSFDLAAQVRQIEAAYDLLRAQPEVNPAKLLIAGHSEGGMTAMLAASTVRPAPVGLALLEPQDERFLDLVSLQLDEQMDDLVAAGQTSAQAAAAVKAAISRIVADFRAGRPLDTTGLEAYPGLVAFFQHLLSPTSIARFTRTDDAVYPPAIAARIKPGRRVLVTCGTADVQVPCSTIGPLVGALVVTGTHGPGLTVLPGIDHDLHPQGTPVNDPILAPAVERALHAFARPWATH